MSDKKLLADPTNRIVSFFTDPRHADEARQELIENGVEEAELQVRSGSEAADEVDTSAKWFADTDVEIKKYHAELLAGNTIISVPITDSAGREAIHAILKRHHAHRITHFGRWITKMMR